MMNAITTCDAKIVVRLLDKHAHDGAKALAWGKYRYHIAGCWDGNAWRDVVVRTPRETPDHNGVLYCYL